MEQSAILVNGTSVGMAPDTDASIIEDSSFFIPGKIAVSYTHLAGICRSFKYLRGLKLCVALQYDTV